VGNLRANEEVAPCAGDEILVETLRRVRRIIMEKRQRSPLPVNDLDSRPCLTPPVRIERPAHKSRIHGETRKMYFHLFYVAAKRHNDTTSVALQ
jgi:hypothetical protein